MFPTNFPRLNTSRLVLRLMTPEDIPALVHHGSHRLIARHIKNISYPYNSIDAGMRLSKIMRGFNSKSQLILAIESKDDEEMIGEVVLNFGDQETDRAELAYWIGQKYWRLGLMTEVLNEIVRYGRDELKLTQVLADTRSDNDASIGLLRKLDFEMISSSPTQHVFRRLL